MSYIDELFSSTIYSSLASSMIDQIWKYIYSAFKTFTILDMGLDNDFFFLDVISKAQENWTNGATSNWKAFAQQNNQWMKTSYLMGVN